MTYSPGSPGNSGYQPGSYGAPSPGSYGSPAPAPSYTPPAEPGPSKLPEYLNIAVVLLGIGAYVAAFGPVFTASTNLGPFSVEATSTGGILLTLATVLAALLAAIGLLPKTKGYPTLIALLAVLGLLAVVEQIVNKPQAATIGWALWLVLAFVVLQAAAAVVVLLFDTGVLTPPAPKPPRYEAPYGSYGSYGQQYGGQGGYYGQQQPGQHTPQHAAPPSAQRPNYPPRSVRQGSRALRPAVRRLPAGTERGCVQHHGTARRFQRRSADTADRLPELQPTACGRLRTAPGERRGPHAGPGSGTVVPADLGSHVRFVADLSPARSAPATGPTDLT